LTEAARYGWYYKARERNLSIPFEHLRNVGEPEWRQVNFPITRFAEDAVRIQFWDSVTFKNADGWWIAWVPENGYFEINVPENFDYGRLQRYWQVADPSYRYVVVRADGTTLGKKQF
jgi:hypothetical protein